RIFRTNSRLDRAGIGLQGGQGIRYVLERGNDGGAVLGFGLFESCLGRLLLIVKREAVEYRRGGTCGDRIESGSGRKALCNVEGGRSAVGRKHDVWQAGRH